MGADSYCFFCSARLDKNAIQLYNDVIGKKQNERKKHRKYADSFICGAVSDMKKIKGIMCLTLVLAVMLVLCMPIGFADTNVEVEEAVDEVAQKEAEEAAAKAAEEAERAAAEAEAARVKDVVDLDANAAETEAETPAPTEAVASAAQQPARSSGARLGLIVGLVLVGFGVVVIIMGDKKSKAGKKGKASKYPTMSACCRQADIVFERRRNLCKSPHNADQPRPACVRNMEKRSATNAVTAVTGS